MAINFDDCTLVGIVNPNLHCTQINYVTNGDAEVSEKVLVLFDQQIKYIQVEAHPSIRRVKIYVRGEEDAINIDFPVEEVELYDLFLRSLYNK
ncbi:MAG: hypothetical protein WCO66_01690 [Candidatus Absconditabacteria bacterium]